MELLQEEYLAAQDYGLRVDPLREESDNGNDDVDYSNDDLGENTEITPLGDAIENDDVDDLRIDPDDDDYGDDEDIDLETEEELEEEEDVVDLSSQIDPDEDDDLDDDDDLLSDDDDLDTTITPDLDEDDDLLSDDDEDFDDETTARTSIDTDADFASRPHGRTTGTMIDHEPGLPGTNDRDYNL